MCTRATPAEEKAVKVALTARDKRVADERSDVGGLKEQLSAARGATREVNTSIEEFSSRSSVLAGQEKEVEEQMLVLKKEASRYSDEGESLALQSKKRSLEEAIQVEKAKTKSRLANLSKAQAETASLE